MSAASPEVSLVCEGASRRSLCHGLGRRVNNLTMPDGELAWTNVPGVLRIHRQVWRGMIREGEENLVHGRKLHPAQKPVALLTWCVATTTGTVLDPYMGS